MRFVWNNCCECEISLHHQYNTVLYTQHYEKIQIQCRLMLTNTKNLRNFRHLLFLTIQFPHFACIYHHIQFLVVAIAVDIQCVCWKFFVQNVLFISRWPKCKISIKHVVVYGAQPCIDTSNTINRVRVIELLWRIYRTTCTI